jgi:hypothetical protein
LLLGAPVERGGTLDVSGSDRLYSRERWPTRSRYRKSFAR